MPATAEIFGSSIVVVGSFNPAIFSPDWLVKAGLIGESDAEAARTSPTFVVTRQASIFDTDWFAIQILENQLALTSKGALSHAFKDLAEGILLTLPHTPVTGLGLNFMGHFRLASKEDFHHFGDTLAPKAVWRTLFDSEQYRPGLNNLGIRFQRTDGNGASTSSDELRVNVEASTKVPHGVYLLLNDHREEFARQTDRQKSQAERAAELIGSSWEKTWQEANRVFASLLSEVLPERGS